MIEKIFFYALKKAPAAACICLTVFSLATHAAEIPIIDAHSQVDHDVDLKEVIRLMNKGGVSHTILGMRGKVKPKALADFAAVHPGRITPALRTKGWAYALNKPKYYRFLEKQLLLPGFGALGEVLLYHAKKGEIAPEWVVEIEEPQVQAALKIALDKRWPFIVHIEFAAVDFGRDEWMKNFEALAQAYPAHSFPLIHMGQLGSEEAGRLIRVHPNVYFMTSHSNPVTVNGSNQPWVNLFKGKRIAPDWKKLILRHPDRFILAFDNVFADHWGDYYLEQIDLWQKALAELPPKAAHALAHGNAERLWRLPPAKPFPIK
jgi:hypothetical protein